MNSLPTITAPRCLALIEERPGMAGQEWLSWLMDSLGHPLDRCMRGYLSTGAALARDLAAWKPNVVVCMGDEVLRAFHPDPGAKATAWRGSLWTGTLTLGSTHSDQPGEPTPQGFVHNFPVAETACLPFSAKCIAVLHPSDPKLRLSEWSPLLKFDLRRALEEATTPALTLPERHIAWDLSFDETMGRLEALRGHSSLLGHDLEGWPGTGVTDFSFATSPTEAFWVPIRHTSWAKWWSDDEEAAILAATKAVLEDPGVGKVCHNGASECFTWRWAHGIKLRGLADDSMLAFHELFCELEKNLSTVASLLTRQPYWGEAKDQATPLERATYNCLDSMLSLEVAQAIKTLPEWTPSLESHYRHRLALVRAALDQELRGIRLDLDARSALLDSLDRAILEAQGDIDRLAGIEAPTLREVAGAVCSRKAWSRVTTWDDVVTHANPSWRKRATPSAP